MLNAVLCSDDYCRDVVRNGCGLECSLVTCRYLIGEEQGALEGEEWDITSSYFGCFDVVGGEVMAQELLLSGRVKFLPSYLEAIHYNQVRELVEGGREE